MKSLVGDRSDEIAGIYNFGIKDFQKLCETFSITGMLNLDEIIRLKRKSELVAAVADFPEVPILATILNHWYAVRICYVVAGFATKIDGNVTLKMGVPLRADQELKIEAYLKLGVQREDLNEFMIEDRTAKEEEFSELKKLLGQ
jgi:5'-3' exonuclease